jgi:hypothetical protein
LQLPEARPGAEGQGDQRRDARVLMLVGADGV